MAKPLLSRRSSFATGVPLLAAWLLLGCATGGTRKAASSVRPAAGKPPRAMTLHGKGPIASSYDVRTPVELTQLPGGVVEQLRRAAVGLDRLPPDVDRQAVAAAAEVCRGLPERGPPPSALVEFAMRSKGLIEPPPHMVIADLPTGADVSLALESLGQRFKEVLAEAAYSRAGVADCRPEQTPGRRRLVVALLESHVKLRPPLARVWRVGVARTIRATVSAGYRKPRLVIAEPGRAVSSRPMVADGAEQVARASCRTRGIQRVEITAEGRFGSEVLANFPVYCDVPAPTEVSYELGTPVVGDVGELEAEIARRTNEVRRRAGLSALRRLPALAQVARQHCKDMKLQAFVGHVSPTTGNAADRVRRAGIGYFVVRENVARAYSASEAISELMNSPAHRRNILATDVTHIGVGVDVERGAATPVLLVTQNFIRPAAPYNPATARGEALQTIARARRAAGRPALRIHAELDALARRYLRAITEGQGQQQADAQLSASLRRATNQLRRVDGMMVKVTGLEELASVKEFADGRITHLGLAVAQHQGRIVVFALLGRN